MFAAQCGSYIKRHYWIETEWVIGKWEEDALNTTVIDDESIVDAATVVKVVENATPRTLNPRHVWQWDDIFDADCTY